MYIFVILFNINFVCFVASCFLIFLSFFFNIKEGTFLVLWMERQGYKKLTVHVF